MPFWTVYSYFYGLSLRNLLPYVRLLEDLSNTLDIKGGETILDAGCGPGLVIEKMIKGHRGRELRITGIDIDKGMLKQAHRRCRNLPNVKLQLADVNRRLEFPDNSFDRVLCSNTLYALEDPGRALAEFHRVLKPGGAVIIANPKPCAEENALIKGHIQAINELTPMYKRIYHIIVSVLLIPVYLFLIAINKIILEKAKSGEYHFLDEEELRGILQQAGFTIVSIRSCYADQDWLVEARKQSKPA